MKTYYIYIYIIYVFSDYSYFSIDVAISGTGQPCMYRK
jgi:hypothetical protein